MKNKNIIFLAGALLIMNGFAINLYAQDIHFSQYQASPLIINSSNTGSFDGDYRFGLNYRNQWSSFIKPFVTYSGFFDKLFKKELLGNDSFGVGLVLFSDNAGTAEFSTQSAIGSFGYHKKIDNEGKQVVSFGLQGGIMQKGFNYDNLKFGNQYESAFYNSELESKETFSEQSISYPILHAGLGWYYNYNANLNFNAGFSLFNINMPKESFYGAEDNFLNRRMSLTIGADYLYNPLITISPGILFTGQTKAFEYLVGSTVGYKVREVPLLKVIALMGIWYRSTDAIILAPGLQYNNYRFGLSYDINISSLNNASGGRGALEMSLIYIFNTNPKLGIKRTVPCKRL